MFSTGFTHGFSPMCDIARWGKTMAPERGGGKRHDSRGVYIPLPVIKKTKLSRVLKPNHLKKKITFNLNWLS